MAKKQRTIAQIDRDIKHIQQAIADLQQQATNAGLSIEKSWRDSDEKDIVQLLSIERRRTGAENELQQLQLERVEVGKQNTIAEYRDMVLQNLTAQDAQNRAKQALNEANEVFAGAEQHTNSTRGSMRKLAIELNGLGVTDEDLAAIRRDTQVSHKS